MSTNITNTIEYLNAAVSEWGKQFDHEGCLNFRFSVTEYGTLIANDRLLCCAKDVDFDSISYDVDTITFIAGDDIFDINIHWPFLGAPYVKYITKTSVLYKIS